MSHINPWQLSYRDFKVEEEGLREALCTLGNGFFATRGAGCESLADDVHYPATYLAGGYNRLKTEMTGRQIENEDLVNMPNWLPIRFRCEEGEWFSLDAVEMIAYQQTLHFKEGVLNRDMHFRDAQGRESRLSERRLVHMQQQHLAAIEWHLIPINWSGKIEICAALDGRVCNAGVSRYRKLNSHHLEPLESEVSEDGRLLFLKVQTNQSKVQISQAARIKLTKGDVQLLTPCRGVKENGYAAVHFTIEASAGEPIRMEKIIAFFTSRDHAISECGLEAHTAINRAPDFANLYRTHKRYWEILWKEFDIEIETAKASEENLMILRLHLFHLLQTASPNTLALDVGIPARGWHGEAYRGHIFWDEIFIFPTYNLRMPKITGALLKYRYYRLNEAREAAKMIGARGAMFPWQSGSNGREESQQLHLNPKSGRWIPDHSSIQRHVNAAIAYNFWRYYEVTGDIDYLRSYGAEVILEIARFWASITTYNEKLDRYEILNVMGPDEYHDAYPNSSTPGLNNNAYTNIMAVWIFCRALEMLNTLSEDHRNELCTLLDLQPSELEAWEQMSRKMRIVFHGDGEIISQFEGYEKLLEFPWVHYRQKYGQILRLDRILEAENDSCNRYQLSKQADLLMLFYLFSKEELQGLFERLGYALKPHWIPKNIHYYLHRTSHGSTLSKVVHAWVLAREDRAASWELFTHALESDISDVQGGTTKEGIHLGAMAGTVDIIQRCYTGIETSGGILRFNPFLPEDLKRLKLHLHFQGHSLEVELTHHTLTVSSRHAAAKEIQIGIGEAIHVLSGEKRVQFPLQAKQAMPVS